VTGTFDAYHVWLGIPPAEQPPNHYRLLGIALYESDPTVIEHAADRQMAHLRTFQTGGHGDLSQRLLNEVAAAKLCLLHPEKKLHYDQALRQRLAELGSPTPPPELATPPPEGPAGGPWENETLASSTASRLLVGAATVVGLLLLGAFLWSLGSGGKPPRETMLVFDWPESQREGATLVVDGQPVPVLSTGPLEHVCPPGEHHIVATRWQFEPFERTVRVKKGERLRIDLVWAEAVLVFDWPKNEREGATLQIDAADVPVVPEGLLEYPCPPGRHRIVITRPGFMPIDRTVAAVKGMKVLKLVWAPCIPNVKIPDLKEIPPPKPEWVDASRAEIREGSFAFRVHAVVKSKPPFLLYTGSERLFVEVRVENVGSRDEVYLLRDAWRSWLADRVSLTDNLGNSYRQQFTAGLQPHPSSIPFGEASDELLVFEPPSKDAAFLRLELPVGKSGGGSLKFKIPLSMITAAAKPRARLPVPSEADQARARKTILEVYKREYDEAVTSPQKEALAEMLFQKGLETRDDPAGRFMLLKDAGGKAVEAEDLKKALSILDRMAELYQIDPLQMKAEIIISSGRTANSPAQHKWTAEQMLQLTDEAVVADNFAAAKRLGGLALAEGAKAEDSNLYSQVQERTDGIEELAKIAAEAKTAVPSLEKNPTDPEANLKVGKYDCFVKGAFCWGLPMLASGNDRVLQELAARDLQAGTAPDEQVGIADAWWDLAAKNRGVAKKQLRGRAESWYRKALPRLQGFTKKRVEQRLQEVAGTAAQTPITQPIKPAGPAQPLTIISTVDELNRVLANLAEQRVMWVQLEEKDVNAESLGQLRAWVYQGGVLWLDTDLAKRFGFPLPEAQPQFVEGRAYVWPNDHSRPIPERMNDWESVRYHLSDSRRLVSVVLNKGKLSFLITPLLAVAIEGDRLLLVCAQRSIGRGAVVYRPRQITNLESDAGARFERNLRSWSMERAQSAAPAQPQPPKQAAERQEG
jgi:hypothetical protein